MKKIVNEQQLDMVFKMKQIMMIILLSIQAFSMVYANDNTAKQDKTIMFETKIYRLLDDSSDAKALRTQMENAVLEEAPSLVTKAGEQASLKIGLSEETGNKSDMIMMYFAPDQMGETFDMKLELVDGNNTVISEIEGSAIDQQLNFSAKLNDVRHIFSVKATHVNFKNENSEFVATTDDNNIAAEKQCGRVSVFFKPPQNERFFHTSIFNVNDNNVNIAKTTHQLPLGKNTISVTNSGGLFTGNSKRRYKGSGKAVEIIVKPNMTYHIAAKFISEKRYQIRNDEDWEPVVWKITEQKCEL